MATASADQTTASTRPRARRRRKGYPDMTKPPSHLTGDVIAYLGKLSLAQLICLAYGHIWPVLVPGRGRPRGWRANLAPDHEGAFLITELCIRDALDSGETCGSERTTYTGAHGIFMERGRHRQYRREKGKWLIRPDGMILTRIDVIDYITWRMAAEGELFNDGALDDGGRP